DLYESHFINSELNFFFVDIELENTSLDVSESGTLFIHIKENSLTINILTDTSGKYFLDVYAPNGKNIKATEETKNQYNELIKPHIENYSFVEVSDDENEIYQLYGFKTHRLPVEISYSK
ncbi:hypothetical protein N9N67_09810, partial [Bacteriovoracaceae bacterium]|nr:hypothetical protein [Bacteriovoracaceae bacterium]